MSDHLKIFGDEKVKLEDILAKKGAVVKRLGISLEGDLEFWEGEGEGKY